MGLLKETLNLFNSCITGAEFTSIEASHDPAKEFPTLVVVVLRFPDKSLQTFKGTGNTFEEASDKCYKLAYDFVSKVGL
jgi:hypothetical protein